MTRASSAAGEHRQTMLMQHPRRDEEPQRIVEVAPERVVAVAALGMRRSDSRISALNAAETVPR